MNFLNKETSKYGLHDTLLNKISLCEKGIILYFNKGIYKLDNTGIQLGLSEKCSIEIIIDSFDVNSLYEHIVIQKIIKDRIKEIDCATFLEEINSNIEGLLIDIEYYSDFAKSILIKGSLGKIRYELIITEIEKLDYKF